MNGTKNLEGMVEQAASGQWSWAVECEAVPIASGAGYATEEEAFDEMQEELELQQGRIQ